MASVFASILRLFERRGPDRQDIVQRLHAAMEDGERLEFQPLDSLEPDPPTAMVDLANVDDTALIISPPAPEIARRMRHGRRFAISFFEETGRVNGEIVCEGRVRMQSAGGDSIHGFRFSLPTALMRVERRHESRQEFTPAEAPKVELTSFERPSPVYGVLVNLSRGGARLRCRNAERKLETGQQVYLKMTLPEPAGLVTEMVRVLELTPCPDSPEMFASVSFLQHVQVVNDLLDSGGFSIAPRQAG